MSSQHPAKAECELPEWSIELPQNNNGGWRMAGGGREERTAALSFSSRPPSAVLYPSAARRLYNFLLE